jgi:hypothetical protein
VRWATLAIVTWLAGCNDLRDFRGAWEGPRVGDVAALRVGAGDRAGLAIEELDAHHIAGRLTIDGVMADQPFSSLPGAEADALANLTFAGDPLRVYLAFVGIPGGGDALALIALYDDHRIEVRVLRGGASPLYAIFALASAPGS